MLQDYKIALVTNRSALTTYQRIRLRATIGFLRDHVENLIIFTPGFGLKKPMVTIDPAVLEYQHKEKTKLEVKGFSKQQTPSDVAEWIKEQRCDQYLGFPRYYSMQINRDLAWGVIHLLKKANIHVPVVNPWLSETNY